MIRDAHVYFNKLDRIAHMFINEHLKETGLSRGLFFYFVELSHHDGITLRDLSRAVFVDKAYTTRAVSKLIELGYIDKKENEFDSRSSKIFLTESGHEMADKINNIFIEWRDLISNGLTEQEVSTVVDISHKLYENAFQYYCDLESKK